MTKDILVVKVGTSMLLGSHEQPSKVFDSIAQSIIDLSHKNNIVLVTSGAIGFGVTQLKLDERPQDVSQLQALSMIGQVGLLRRWREAFHGITIGQVLVTRNDLADEYSAKAFRNSIGSLWQYGSVPVVNENDAVSTEEISFGDNDRLAAEVAVCLGARRLVLLTDQDGIQADFQTQNQRRLDKISVAEAAEHILPTKSVLGKGGVSSKVVAASVALQAGVEVFVAHAATLQAIESAISGKTGTKIVQ